MGLGDFLGFFDWITPALSLAQQASGKVETFVVSPERVDETIQLLDSAGVKMSNTSFLPGKFVFDVVTKDSRKVERLLR